MSSSTPQQLDLAHLGEYARNNYAYQQQGYPQRGGYAAGGPLALPQATQGNAAAAAPQASTPGLTAQLLYYEQHLQFPYQQQMAGQAGYYYNQQPQPGQPAGQYSGYGYAPSYGAAYLNQASGLQQPAAGLAPGGAGAAAAAVAASANYLGQPLQVGQVQPTGLRPRVTTTMWEDEKTLCYQVDANNVLVVRRADNNMINGTKLLNVAQMTRGRRDGILKSEKVRHVVKIGLMHLKGVWIPFERALAIAQREGIVDQLYPLFVRDIKQVIQQGAVAASGANAAYYGQQPAAQALANGAKAGRLSANATPVANSATPVQPANAPGQAPYLIPSGGQYYGQQQQMPSGAYQFYNNQQYPQGYYGQGGAQQGGAPSYGNYGGYSGAQGGAAGGAAAAAETEGGSKKEDEE